ncbi:MAG: hypothetical protein ACYSYL_18875, partial [Planctomycetota bacterium]
MLLKRNLPILSYLPAYKVFSTPVRRSYLCAYKALFKHFGAKMDKKHLFSRLLNKAISMALWTKAITCDKAGFKSRFCQEHQAGKNIISVNPVILSIFSSCPSCASWLKNPFNQRNLRLINDLRLFKALYNCR